jgi:hypothetical protein
MAESQRRRKHRAASRISVPVRGASSLQQLLEELAFVLLARGMTPKTFSELSRSAFVQAAAARSRLRNGRVNHSRVAAQTGLTRADVKRVLDQDRSETSLVPGQTAVERVMSGWLTDRLFCRRVGEPKSLRISGTNASFNILARKYAGDVPSRAVLDELERIGAVIVDGEFLKLRPSRHLRTRHDFGFLNVVVPALIDGLRIASTTTKSGSAAAIHRLVLPVSSELDLAFVRDRCTTTARAMLDGLSHSLAAKVTRSRGKSKPRPSVAVTVLLVENHANKTQRELRKMGRGTRYGH